MGMGMSMGMGVHEDDTYSRPSTGDAKEVEEEEEVEEEVEEEIKEEVDEDEDVEEDTHTHSRAGKEALGAHHHQHLQAARHCLCRVRSRKI